MSLLLSSLVQRPSIYQRNGVSYIAARNWRSDAKRGAIQELKRAKATRCCETCAQGVEDVAAVIAGLLGSSPAAVVTSVPCGHSRVPDCLGRRLAEGVAAKLGIPYVQSWHDRFVSGVSHPKEFAKLPPLEWLEKPRQSTILIDDVATSGWHMEEALNALRGAGVEASGVAWIGGTRGADRGGGKSAADRPGFGGSGGGWAGGGGRGGQWGVPRR